MRCRYEASQMHWKNGLAQGFALFTHGEAARMAISSIHSLVFDDGAVRDHPTPASRLLSLIIKTCNFACFESTSP